MAKSLKEEPLAKVLPNLFISEFGYSWTGPEKHTCLRHRCDYVVVYSVNLDIEIQSKDVFCIHETDENQAVF